jgi:hypothetical protein
MQLRINIICKIRVYTKKPNARVAGIVRARSPDLLNKGWTGHIVARFQGFVLGPASTQAAGALASLDFASLGPRALPQTP